jgi:hypothetical protein
MRALQTMLGFAILGWAAWPLIWDAFTDSSFLQDIMDATLLD